MQLSIPHRTVADTDSFPVNPEGVAQWLSKLRPLQSEANAREVYRGLKHSNRLHNDVSNRRLVISCFVPTLRELQNHLSELSDAQPLPLTREFARHARLRDALLREEAFAFKILLSDSDKPLADDARRAMQALARQAESLVHAYRHIPDALIEDAHQLYALAEEHHLLVGQRSSELPSCQDHYRYILLLCISDLKQQRVRQLPLIMDFLRSTVVDIHIERDRKAETITPFDFAINLRRGSRPEPALSLLGKQYEDVRWFSVAPVLYRINHLSKLIQANAGSAPGMNTLEKQSLSRLHSALSRSRQRRCARSITDIPQRVVLGHKEISAHLSHKPTQIAPDDDSGWVVINRAPQGLCLYNKRCRAGLVQVGELVSIADVSEPLINENSKSSSRINILLGTIRWVRSEGALGITVGVEFMARTVLPVAVTRQLDKENNSESSNSIDEPIDEPIGATTGETVGEPSAETIAENALIVACRVNAQVLQTILLPSYLYNNGDKLIASQGGRTRRIQLRNCMQSNGMFSQFSLVSL